MSLSSTSSFLQSHLPLLEKYWIASDKQKFINSITNQYDKKLLILLTNPLPDNYEEIFKELKIPQDVKNQLLQAKLIESLRTSQQAEEKQKSLYKYIDYQYKNITFDYPKPVQTTNFTVDFNQSTNNQDEKLNEEKSKLVLQQTLQKYLEKLINQNYTNFQILNDYGIKQLKEDFLLNLHVDNKKFLIDKIYLLNTFSDEFIGKFLLSYAEPLGLVRKVPFYELIPTTVIQNLTKSQINTLKDLKKQFMNNLNFTKKWFEVNYLQQIELKNRFIKKSKTPISQLDKRRKILISIHQELKQIDSQPLKPFENHLFYEILVLDLKREDPDKELFYKFLQNIEGISSFLNKQFRQVLNKKYGRRSISQYSAIGTPNMLSCNFRVETLINQYIKKIFKKYKDSQQIKSQMSKYLDFNILNSSYAKIKLEEGEQIPNLNDILSKHQLEELKNSKEITIITEKTEKYFKAEDDVQLTVRIKNIKQIKLKIYQMNMEQFYLQNPNGQIDDNINLQYLNPTYQELIQLKEFKSCYQIIEQQLLIEKIPKGCGFYIVELLGQGITSRALIRKGAIACFQEQNINGKLLKFYDETGNPINKIKIWVNGRSQVLPEAEYLIPFDKNTTQVNVLAVRDNFVQKFDIYLYRQNYSFKVGLIYNHESFIVGKKSKVIIHPSLFLGDKKISLQNIRNIKVTSVLINNQNIKSSQRFQNVKFSDEKDYILQIPIKSYTKSIQISIEGQVKNLQGEVIKLHSNNIVTIELMEGTTNFIDMYLTRTNNGKTNILKVRGLNGQPLENMDVTFCLALYGCTREQTRILRTNSKGQVNLGSLTYVNTLSALVNTIYGSIKRTWKLWELVQEVSYFDKQLIYHKDQQVIIPLPFNWNIQSENINSFFYFKQKENEQNQSSQQNKIDSIKIVKQNSSTYLHFHKLTAGCYDLRFLMLDKSVTVRIVDGIKWPNGSIFNEKSGQVYKINQSPLIFVSLGQIREEKGEKQNTKKITIPISTGSLLSEDSQSIRVHVFLKNNQDSEDRNINNSFPLESYNQIPDITTQRLTYQKSNYYSNKPLSDEHSYVINRQNEKQFIGNNLQKPRIFLKRIEVRDTTQTAETLSKEGQYQTHADLYGGGGGGRQMFKEAQFRCHDQLAMNQYNHGRRGYVLMNYDLNSHNNFFALSGHSILNCQFKKQLSFMIPQGYNQVLVYLISQNSAIKKQFYLQSQTDEKKKNLKHLGLEQSNQTTGWSMSRQIYQMQKGEKRSISRDSIWCTVSLSTILQFAQIKGHKLPEWISQWKIYTPQKKLQVYDKQVCHQLNAYIKHQDQDFFDKIVTPFIRNKITKTFVDLCILGDKSALEYASSHKIRTLNQFEKVLLIENLIENGMKNEAKMIATSMQLEQKSVKRSFETYKELFDIVLNSQASSPKQKLLQASQVPQPALFSAPNAFGGSFASEPFNASYNLSRGLKARMMGFQPPDQLQECLGEAELMNDDFDDFQSQEAQKKMERKRKNRQANLRQLSPTKFKPGFKEVEKTKQYTETTYAGMKNPKLSNDLIQKNLFWAHVAAFLTSENQQKKFLSEAFLYFTKPIEFTLACCFFKGDFNADYEISNQNDNFIIQANNSFMLFVKQVKQLQYADKFGVLINQRFFNPEERFTYEDDGTQIQKITSQFLVKKPYTLQTVVTNTSGTNLQLQLLMDIPVGAIPLMSHQYVQIINVNINSFSTTSFERLFYFPSEGTSTLYPANASRNNIVIAKAKRLPQICVKLIPTVNKMESFSDVLRSGSKKQILDYIEKRNIFDQNVFTPYSILWMLKDKDFFQQVIEILRKRNYFDQNLWIFGIYHKDSKSIIEYIESIRPKGLNATDIPVFEYFPYFSRRTHKFLNESKSTIRNIQFKETYKNFIINSLVCGRFSSLQKITFAYYLLLQDRIDECAVVFKSMNEQEKKNHEIQSDYLACYLSMYQDYPNFSIAETISEKYQNYPILTWNMMFKQIFETLKEYRSDIDIQEDIIVKRPSSFNTSFVNEGENIKLNIPEDTKVQLYFYDINLELYFSDYPFDQIKSLSVIKPKVSKVFLSGGFREQKIAFSQVQNLGNMIVQIHQFKEGVPPLKIGSFFWANPKIKVKISQNQGTLQVFNDGKKQAGCYVKVYSTGTTGNKFYRDGYTDITGKFKYALADLQGLSKFSILTITKQGGVISQANPPSILGRFSEQ